MGDCLPYSRWSFFAVFDGHAGSIAAEHAAATVVETLKENEHVKEVRYRSIIILVVALEMYITCWFCESQNCSTPMIISVSAMPERKCDAKDSVWIDSWLCIDRNNNLVPHSRPQPSQPLATATSVQQAAHCSRRASKLASSHSTTRFDTSWIRYCDTYRVVQSYYWLGNSIG